MNKTSGVGQKGGQGGERKSLKPYLATPHSMQSGSWKPPLTFGLVRGLLTQPGLCCHGAAPLVRQAHFCTVSPNNLAAAQH